MFAELERKVADKRAAGIDVISLGIGDPDRPTYPHVVEAMQAAVADSSTHQYPSNRGRDEFREALARFYDRRFGAQIDPESEVMRRQHVNAMSVQRAVKTAARQARLRKAITFRPGLSCVGPACTPARAGTPRRHSSFR